MNKLHVELSLFYSIDDLKDEDSMDEEECYGDYIFEKECKFAQNIENAILENESEFNIYMNEVSTQYNIRALYMTGTLRVNEVRIILPSASGSVSVEYDYDAYYGCQDMDVSGSIDESWNFQIEGNKVIFDLEIPERDDEI
jgi:hypothetical protein